MHVVIWTSQRQRYATPSEVVAEVIPVVQSRPVPGSEPWLTGLFNYRGALLPLYDSSQLLRHQSSELRMSSRILVIHLNDRPAGETADVGLLVEHVLGAKQLEIDDDLDQTQPHWSDIDFLGPVARTANGTVQLTAPARLPTVKTGDATS